VRARFHREAVRGVCDTGRYRMPYFVWGSGPPLVFVHGLGDCHEGFLQPISLLSRHFRCIAYNQPLGTTGHHGDGACVNRYRHADLVEDLFALLDHVAAPRTYIYGSSFGSVIVLTALARQPERFARAILQGGLACRPLRRIEYLLAHIGRFLPGRVKDLPGRTIVLREIFSRYFVGREPECWDHFCDCTGRTTASAMARFALLLHRIDLRRLLPRIRQPLLLVCGDADVVVGPEFQDVLQQGLPNAGRLIIPSCGHIPSYTHPEILAEVIRQFLTPPGEQR
jgi:pimeloyl-ACP methyl ester carboxylesterase